MKKVTLTPRTQRLLKALAASGGDLIELLIWRPHGRRQWGVNACAEHLSTRENIYLSMEFIVFAPVPRDSVDDEQSWSVFEEKVERVYEWLRDHYPGTIHLVYAIRDGQPYPVQRKKRKCR